MIVKGVPAGNFVMKKDKTLLITPRVNELILISQDPELAEMVANKGFQGRGIS
jgi:hypothetical protein